MRKKIMKTSLTALIVLLSFIIISVISYITYLAVDYERMDDLQEVDWENPSIYQVRVNEEYSVMTYNMGFGAYDHDFTFFMDKGKMLNGKKVKGKQSIASSLDKVTTNTTGMLNIIKEYDPDFLLLQEIDTEAKRSHYFNQYGYLLDELPDYASFYASNFDSSYLFYPFHQPIGRTKSGLALFTKYIMQANTRHQLPVSTAFLDRFFDLDRCFTVSRALLDGNNELVVINTHFSAYDKDGEIKKLQYEVLKKVMISEYEKGNYVIVGGDFNSDLANTMNAFETKQEKPNWVVPFNDEQLPAGYQIAASDLDPTCRSADIPYQKGVNYTVVVDGYIVSSNIEVIAVTNIVKSGETDTSFKYSDHNPVLLKFKLVYKIS